MITKTDTAQPREFTSYMKAMMEATGHQPGDHQAALDNKVVNHARIDAAAKELAEAARTTVRVAPYQTMATKNLREKLENYDRAVKGGKDEAQ